jgi:long-subunit fatty acid transport protein
MFMNDDTTIDVVYQNTNAYNLGIGYYFTNKLYMSASYNASNSIYDGVEDIETASFYGYYSIDENWFSTFSYAKGISDTASQNYASLRLGYFF